MGESYTPAFVASTVGSSAARFVGPLSLFAFAIVFWLGVAGYIYWWLLLLSAAAAVINLALVWSWWVQLGISNQWISPLPWMWWTILVGSTLLFFLGKLVRRVSRKLRKAS
jgi:hypothetical protein